MAQTRLIEGICDRCDYPLQLPDLDEFQSLGWRTVSNKPFGSSDDHPGRTNLDLCGGCALQLAEFFHDA